MQTTSRERSSSPPPLPPPLPSPLPLSWRGRGRFGRAAAGDGKGGGPPALCVRGARRGRGEEAALPSSDKSGGLGREEALGGRCEPACGAGGAGAAPASPRGFAHGAAPSADEEEAGGWEGRWGSAERCAAAEGDAWESPPAGSDELSQHGGPGPARSLRAVRSRGTGRGEGGGGVILSPRKVPAVGSGWGIPGGPAGRVAGPAGGSSSGARIPSACK